MDNRFWLIQRGEISRTFKETGIFNTLTGEGGLIDLEYMGSAEYEFGTVNSSYRRIMGQQAKYHFYRTGIFAVNKKELIVYCNEETVEYIIEGITEFIKNPYPLKRRSNLEMIKIPASIANPSTQFTTRFWWCVEKSRIGDWMAFLEDQEENVKTAIQSDYEEWWMKKTSEKRKQELEKAWNSCY